MMQLNWTCNSIMSSQVSFHMYAMQSAFACRRKQPLPGLSACWISPQKLLQTSMRQKASVTWVIPRCFPPPQAPAAHLPPLFPELLVPPAQPAERRNFLTHAESQEHRLPGLPGSHWHGIDAADERTGMSLGLEKKWSFCGYFCSDPSFSLPMWLLFKISLHVDFWGYCSFQCHMKSLWGSVTDGC